MQLRALIVSAFLAVSIGLAPAVASAPAIVMAANSAPLMFDTEAAAQRHCPSDVRSWIAIVGSKGLPFLGS